MRYSFPYHLKKVEAFVFRAEMSWSTIDELVNSLFSFSLSCDSKLNILSVGGNEMSPLDI